MIVRASPGGPERTGPSIQEALRLCVQQAPVPFAITRGSQHTLVYANAVFCQMLHRADGATMGVCFADLVGVPDAPAMIALLDRALDEGAQFVDVRIQARERAAGDWLCSIWPVVGADARVEAIGVEIRTAPSGDAALDLQRALAEQLLLAALRERGLAEDAEAARRRAAFLAEAGRMLAESVDQASTLVALTRLALPTLGAWCFVDILEEGGTIHRLGIYHPDPDKQALARELETSWVPEPDDPFGAPAMLRDAHTVAITADIELTLAATARTPENLRLLRQLGVGSLLTVPLLARNRLLGAITFVGVDWGTPFSAENVQLAEDLAVRGALALDSAQVYDVAVLLRESAERANRAKTAFLGAMSHELRTPLNAIGGYIQIVDMGLRGPVTEEQHTAFARVRMNQEHLTLLITEILNFVRVGNGRFSYAITDLDAREVMTRAGELVEPLFGQGGLTYDGVVGEPGVIVHADQERVVQILVNLLSNAIKATPEGGHIRAECAASGDEVTMTISDTGIGIPVEKLEAIFEPFVQLKDTLADRESGVGLGLAISRDLARAMKGDLRVQSTLGKGSRFTLILPRGAREPDEESALG